MTSEIVEKDWKMFEKYMEKIVKEYLEEHKNYKDYVGCRDIGKSCRMIRIDKNR